MARQRRSSTRISGALLWPRKAATALSGGRLRALLQLENRLVRGAFSTGRLDVVKLITDQLAADPDNARRLFPERDSDGQRLEIQSRHNLSPSVRSFHSHQIGPLHDGDGGALLRPVGSAIYRPIPRPGLTRSS